MPKSLKSMKDRRKALKLRNTQRKKNYAKSRKNATFSGRNWNIRDIEIILNSPLSDREISKMIGRSVQAIQIKRSRVLGKGR